MDKTLEKILNYFPSILQKEIKNNLEDLSELEEIRVRINKPIVLNYNNKNQILNTIVSKEMMTRIMQYICDNSIYSYQNQICNGYITIDGGHRIGIVGNAVLKDNQIININYISSLNFRIARQIIGASKELLKYIINYNNNTVFNSLIVSSPGARKNHFTS